MGEFMKKAKLVNKPKNKYPSLSNGTTYLIGPTSLNKGTHYYYYDLSGTFLGCLPVDWFEVMNINEDSKTEKRVELRVEQLTLF